jgi:hypothetical protein
MQRGLGSSRDVPAVRFGLAALLLGASLIGCTHYVGRGSDLYHQGRYVEAAHVLEKSEARLSGATVAEQASYGLYRGATLLRLGDLTGAGRWLAYAESVAGSDPLALSPEQDELLRETLISLRVDLDRRAASQPSE